MTKCFKKLLIMFSMIGTMTIMSSSLIVYADPMDPLERMHQETVAVTESGVGEAITPNTPSVVETTSEGETETKTNDAQTAEDWEKEEKETLAVRLMDSIMLFVGVMGVALPTIYMGIYLGARIFPTLFLPIFSFIVRDKFVPEDQPVHIMFLRTIPVAVLGMFMASGRLKYIFKVVWNFVYEKFLT